MMKMKINNNKVNKKNINNQIKNQIKKIHKDNENLKIYE